MNSELITEKLSFHVKSFQESFEILSSCNSLAEMANHFHKILRGSFVTTKVDLFHRCDEKSEWSNLVVNGKDSSINLLVDKEVDKFKIYSNDDESIIFTKAQLVDSSCLGIVLGQKFDSSPYAEIDKITFQIFIQLFDSAYQVLLSSKKEKLLIFSLNNRVSHLYSLIDTGI